MHELGVLDFEVDKTRFGSGAYTTMDNALRLKSGLATQDYEAQKLELW